MSDFHDVRFPLHLAFGTRGGPVRPVEILQFANGSETRNAKIELLEFYESRNGPLYGFRFRDPLDHSADGQIGRGTGGQTEFQLIKHYGDAPYSSIFRGGHSRRI